MNLPIPDLCLVVLIGPSGSGKSSFARAHFRPTEVLSSDYCRGLVSDDENSQDATGDAFDVLHYVAAKRLARGLLTVVDATNVQPESRKSLVDLAREHDVLPVAIVLRLPEDVCHERNRNRPDRAFGPHVVRNQMMQLRRGLRGLEREGFRYVHILNTPEEVAGVRIERTPVWSDRRAERGPFDIVGDVHGCFDELVALLKKLGYGIAPSPGTPGEGWGGGPNGASCEQGNDASPSNETNAAVDVIGDSDTSPSSSPLPSPPPEYRERGPEDAAPSAYVVHPPPGRKAIFLGDLVDRGPKSPEVLDLVMSMVSAGTALCVPGNHDAKLMKKLQGRAVQITHGLAETLEQLAARPPAFVERVRTFIDSLVSHYVLDGGWLVVAHAGMKERYIRRSSRRVREFALYGETTGETDEFGLPVRHNWAAEYRGAAHVIYGHTPIPEADWLNRTLNVDTGCVFGGKLTALRWPEREVVSVPAARTYAQPAKPFLPPPVFGECPVFGERLDGREYVVRPGAYAVARDAEGRVAVVRVPTGVFLPGGGIDAGESAEAALAREVLEEVGHAIEIGRPIGRASQLCGSPDRVLYEKVGTYYAATLGGRVADPTEADHALEWLAPADAIAVLSHEAQRHMVRRATDPALSAQQLHDDVLDLADVTGKRLISTRLHGSLTIPAENATAALEVMSRFAADPRWLVYLPPTMSPTETSDKAGLLEHPQQAFDYFRGQGVGKVVCQEKHMGSRAVVVICRDESAAVKRFGVSGDGGVGVGRGIVYTRTGRRFFDDRGVEAALLDVLHGAIGAAGLWDELASDWFVLDCELMPWSAKARDLLKNQYAAVGSASRASVAAAVAALEQAVARNPSDALQAELTRQRERLVRVNQYVAAYRQYCWPVTSVADLKLAPFHLLAGEGHVYVDKDHLWHMRTLARLAEATPGSPMMATAHRVVDVTVPDEVAAGVAWWEQLTAAGGEGMVVKPLDFVVRGSRGLVQPAVKCRGPAYLRIIYGPEYDAPGNLERLRKRGLGAKRSLATREFALGIEGLERFVRREPLRRVHECAFGVLALESEPVDPRL